MKSRAARRLRARSAARSNSALPVPRPRWRRHHRESELGDIVPEAQVRHADEHQAIVVDTEQLVAIEIDSIDVGGHGFGGKRRAKPEPPVLRWQREKMCMERRARACVEVLDSNVHRGASGWPQPDSGTAAVIVPVAHRDDMSEVAAGPRRAGLVQCSIDGRQTSRNIGRSSGTGPRGHPASQSDRASRELWIELPEEILTCSSIWIYEVDLQAVRESDGKCVPRADRV